jgi:hypothetical protein
MCVPSLQPGRISGLQRGTKMDDFVKDILLAITVTATAMLLSSLPLWLKQ